MQNDAQVAPASTFRSRWARKETLIDQLLAILSGTDSVSSAEPSAPETNEAKRASHRSRALALLQSAEFEHGAAFEHVPSTERAPSPTLDLRGLPCAGRGILGASFVGTLLDYADFTDCTVTDSNFFAADLNFCLMTRARFRNCNLAARSFQSCAADYGDFSDSSFSHGPSEVAPLLDQEPLSWLRSSDEENRHEPMFSTAQYAKFEHCEFARECLSRCDLHGASFSHSTVADCDFRESRMTSCNFDSAILQGSDFRRSQLSNSSFRKADLLGVDFRGSVLQHAVLDEAELVGTALSDADLTSASLKGAQVRDLPWPRPRSVNRLVISGTDFSNARLFERHVKQEQWLEEYRMQVRTSRRWLPKLWLGTWAITSDYGRSAGRLGITSLLIVLLYAGAIAVANSNPSGANTVAAGQGCSTAPAIRLVGQGTGLGLLEPVHLSIDLFTNLGVSRVESLSPVGALLIWSEVAFGWVMLGSMLTVVARKLLLE